MSIWSRSEFFKFTDRLKSSTKWDWNLRSILNGPSYRPVIQITLTYGPYDMAVRGVIRLSQVNNWAFSRYLNPKRPNWARRTWYHHNLSPSNELLDVTSQKLLLFSTRLVGKKFRASICLKPFKTLHVWEFFGSLEKTGIVLIHIWTVYFVYTTCSINYDT